MWALYDSFKRSYYNLRYIYDDYPYPMFIVSKKNDYNIFYTNSEAEKFYSSIRRIKKPAEKLFSRPRNKSRRDTYENISNYRTLKEENATFSHLIEARLKSMFEKEVERSLAYCK